MNNMKNIIASPLMASTYQRYALDYYSYTARIDDDHGEQQKGTQVA